MKFLSLNQRLTLNLLFHQQWRLNLILTLSAFALDIFSPWCRVESDVYIKEMVMDVSSVSSGASAYTNALKQSNPAQQAQQAQAVERREPRPEERVEKKEEAPKPVKNAEGQTTGSTISVTA
jgi:hypothetical protein